jgi:sarcosine oxidase gamma subunit
MRRETRRGRSAAAARSQAPDLAEGDVAEGDMYLRYVSPDLWLLRVIPSLLRRVRPDYIAGR